MTLVRTFDIDIGDYEQHSSGDAFYVLSVLRGDQVVSLCRYVRRGALSIREFARWRMGGRLDGIESFPRVSESSVVPFESVVGEREIC